jgi:2-dehydro-3-deoxygalactonokinase
MSDPFLAIDWGTTNRRVYLIDNGQVVHTERDDSGALRVADFAGEMAMLRARLGDFPAIMAGMVGSDVGWRKVPYVATPAGLGELASGLTFIDDRTAIVPGLCFNDSVLGRCDIMRGEEVQLLGAVASEVVPSNAVLCQPGTHCKWAWVKDGQITSFMTAMTGELYALIGTHSLLARSIKSGVENLAAFREGVSQGSHRDMAATLFSIRSSIMLGYREPKDAASFASGVLIGADVAARLEGIGGSQVHILADEHMGHLYANAIEVLGGKAERIDSHAAFVAGITTIWNMR